MQGRSTPVGRLWTRLAPIAAGLLALSTSVGFAEAEDDPGEDCNRAIPLEVHQTLAALADPVEEAQQEQRAAHAPEEGARPRPVSLETPEPTRWLPAGRRCRRQRRRMVCDGPRRVPEPYGAAAELATELGIGARLTASHLLLNPPEETWVRAVEGEPPPDRLHWPVDGGSLWRGFGRVRRRRAVRRRLHKGLDIGAADGTPIRSVADGLVVYANNEVHGYGNLLMVVHADASVAYYAHMQAAYVFPGQQVRAGQVLGEVGHTGLARGPHLHFELRVAGRPRDPIRRFEVPERPRRHGA